jgi:aromatic-L-amino-acid decarboxylase
VWLGVRTFGLAALRAEMDRAMDLVRHAESLVRAESSLEVTSPAQLGVLCFRVRGDDALNERVNARVNAGGRYLVSSTRLRGAFTLRLCVLGFRTTRADVDGLIQAVVDAGREA